MRRRIKAWLLRMIRPLFVGDVDPNEDYECCQCGEPVLERHLFCSAKCAAHWSLP